MSVSVDPGQTKRSTRSVEHEVRYARRDMQNTSGARVSVGGASCRTVKNAVRFDQVLQFSFPGPQCLPSFAQMCHRNSESHRSLCDFWCQ